jgi:hypothetical protein
VASVVFSGADLIDQRRVFCGIIPVHRLVIARSSRAPQRAYTVAARVGCAVLSGNCFAGMGQR